MCAANLVCRHTCDQIILAASPGGVDKLSTRVTLATQAAISNYCTALIDRNGYNMKPMWTLPTSLTNKQSKPKQSISIDTVKKNPALSSFLANVWTVPS